MTIWLFGFWEKQVGPQSTCAVPKRRSGLFEEPGLLSIHCNHVISELDVAAAGSHPGPGPGEIPQGGRQHAPQLLMANCHQGQVVCVRRALIHSAGCPSPLRRQAPRPRRRSSALNALNADRRRTTPLLRRYALRHPILPGAG